MRSPPFRLMRLSRLPLLTLFCAMIVSACGRDVAETEPELRPVRTLTVEKTGEGETFRLSGLIEAKTEVTLGFRIGGRVIERLVNVGDKVKPGQLIARLDSQDEELAVQAAQSALTGAEGRLREAEQNYDRQLQLLNRGHTTRQRYDEVVQLVQTLRSQVEQAAAQLAISENRLTDTGLYADAEGDVTARGVEAGQVVQPGQMVVQIARRDGRDAVFDAPPDLISRGSRESVVTVTLSNNPTIIAKGRIREVSPQADPTTGSFRVRVGLSEPPPQMRLGSTVTGQMTVNSTDQIEIPGSALSRSEGKPAVWIVDTKTGTVSLRNIEVAQYNPATVVVAAGLSPGDVVVTAGVQTLRPGQQVRLLGQVS